MKYAFMLTCVVFAVLWSTQETYAQAIYGRNGEYLGYRETAKTGVTSTYSPQGQLLGTQQVDNGQTNYYSPNGVYKGTVTAPTYYVPNSTVSVPRQAPVAPSVKGW